MKYCASQAKPRILRAIGDIPDWRHQDTKQASPRVRASLLVLVQRRMKIYLASLFFPGPSHLTSGIQIGDLDIQSTEKNNV